MSTRSFAPKTVDMGIDVRHGDRPEMLAEAPNVLDVLIALRRGDGALMRSMAGD